MKILAIETSCDETGLALVEAKGGLKAPSFKVLKNLIASQIKIHRPYGGVVPTLAKREHLKNLPILYQQILTPAQSPSSSSKQIKTQIPKIDLLAVTVGPGLEPCLWTGIGFAKQIYQQLKIKNPKLKLIGVNHLEGHLYSFLLAKKTRIFNSKFLISKLFPAIALIVSGGHTILLLMKSLTEWKKLGETRDDAVGEAFDKVARMLDLPYPGGPEIERLAKEAQNFKNNENIFFPRPMIHQKNYDFSFSGLKTAVLYYLRDHPLITKNYKLKTSVAASFQEAAIDVLVSKTIQAAKEFKAKLIILAGGVAANKALRQKLSMMSKQLSINFIAPAMEFNTDNAAMIAAAAYLQYLQKKNRKIIAQGNLNL